MHRRRVESLDLIREELEYKYPERPAALDAKIAKIKKLSQLRTLCSFSRYRAKSLDEIERAVDSFLAPPNGATVLNPNGTEL